MKLVIENGENISLTESLGIAYELVGNFGLTGIIEQEDGQTATYTRETKTNTVFVSATKEDNAITIHTERTYN